MSKKREDAEPGGRWGKLFTYMSANLSNLYHYAQRDYESMVEIRFKHRGGGDWLVIAKRDELEGTPEVLFAQGYDFIGAVLALDNALNAGNWKKDKPWKPG